MRFKVGDKVAVFSVEQGFRDKRVFDRPKLEGHGTIAKRIHPTCFKVDIWHSLLGAGRRTKPWVIHKVYANDLVLCDHNQAEACKNCAAILDEKIKEWEQSDPERAAAWNKDHNEKLKSERDLTETFNHILFGTGMKRKRA